MLSQRGITMSLRSEADQIIAKSIQAVLPDKAVERALQNFHPETGGRTILVAAGKAAWQMAQTAAANLATDGGIVITKYGHVRGEIPGIVCFEAGHPVPDENGVRATQRAMELVRGLSDKDQVLFLLSGGGSALFEKPLVPLEELQDITRQLLAAGADIVEINTIRKRLSAVKGGKFARLCEPARVECIILSDILGDPVDMIASGPACPDASSCGDAQRIAKRYGLRLSGKAQELLLEETPKTLEHIHITVTGSVRELCRAASAAAGIDGMEHAAVFSFGSDGTDGPTDAAGGFVDGMTMRKLRQLGLDADEVLRNNDTYPALQKTGGLIVTGPTGTNVNDVTVGLLDPSAGV